MVIVELYQGSGALLDLHGPQNGPQNGSDEANSRGPSIKKGQTGSFDGPNWSIFFIDLWTTDKLEFTAWFEVNRTFGSRAIIILKTGGLILPPPPD